jgi:hypothetical protein
LPIHPPSRQLIQITLPDSSSDQTSTYPALHGLTQLNYLTRFFFRLDFYLSSLTWSYPAELPYLILLLIRLLPIQPYTVLPDRITLPILSRSNFCLPDRTRPPYSTSLPGRVTLRCTQLLIRPYPITLPARVPFNWPHPKTSSLGSHRDLGLFWLIMHEDSSGNPKPTQVTLKQPE